MVLFAFDAFGPMADRLRNLVPELKNGKFQLSRFENGEMHLDIHSPVREDECLILGSISPPDEQLLSTLLLASTLKKERARQVTAVLPYLAYARHDKDKPGQSMATAFAGSLFQASGCDRLITFDLHSERSRQLFPIPVVSLPAAGIFADAIREYGLCDSTLVAPDQGAVPRCEAIRAAAGMPPEPIPHFEKQRTETGIVHTGPIGRVGPRAVIVDDILDTGTTLVSAYGKLAGAGVQEIYIMVTHGVFSGERWKELSNIGIQRIYCTDSVPRPMAMNGVTTLSVVPVLADYLRGAMPE